MSLMKLGAANMVMTKTEWKSNIILKLGSRQRKKNSACFKKEYRDTTCKSSRF